MILLENDHQLSLELSNSELTARLKHAQYPIEVLHQATLIEIERSYNNLIHLIVKDMMAELMIAERDYVAMKWEDL